MAACRAYWKGYLKLSLVTCPVALYPRPRRPRRPAFTRSTARPATVGKTIEAPSQREDRSDVIDLMEALRERVKGKRADVLRSKSPSKKTAPARKRKKPSRKAA